MEPRARFVPNPPFLCAPVSRDRAFFFPFFFFFSFFFVFHRFERIVLLSGKEIFFFPLEFYRTENRTRYWSNWSAKFELFSSSFFFPRIPSIRKDRSIREGDLFFFFFSPNFIYYIIVIILFVIISSR